MSRGVGMRRPIRLGLHRLDLLQGVQATDKDPQRIHRLGRPEVLRVLLAVIQFTEAAMNNCSGP